MDSDYRGRMTPGNGFKFFFSLISLMTRLQRYSSFRIINEQYGDWGKKSEWERDAYLKIGFRAWYVKNAKGHITYTELNFSSIRGSLLSKTDKSWRVPTLAFAHYIGFSTHKYECTLFLAVSRGRGHTPQLYYTRAPKNCSQNSTIICLLFKPVTGIQMLALLKKSLKSNLILTLKYWVQHSVLSRVSII